MCIRDRALRLSDRLGGHIVSGHIDGLGKVVSIENLKNSWNLRVSWDDLNFCRYMCDKASISINGISLTIAEIYDNGCKFSVGQIQRIALARALYFEPDILILDEPTSGLDKINEQSIFKTILKLSKTITVIMTTHRVPELPEDDNLKIINLSKDY